MDNLPYVDEALPGGVTPQMIDEEFGGAAERPEPVDTLEGGTITVEQEYSGLLHRYVAVLTIRNAAGGIEAQHTLEGWAARDLIERLKGI